MKKILVPCDFSKPAIEAYKFAINIASKTNGEVFVLHVINIPIITDAAMMGGTYDFLMINGIEAEAKKQFEKMKAAWGGSNIPSSLKISNGYTQTVIMSAIESLSIDLVVMGTSGASGIYEIFIGSTTEKVVRHSPVPVLALRTASDPQSIKRILLPTSLSFKETNFISKVKELVNFFNASLQILLINTPIHFKGDKESKSFLKEFAEHHQLENYCIYVRNAYTEEEGIRNFAEEQKSDLIVMSTHARKGLSHFFNGSITEDVVNHIACPVWTFAIEE